MIDEKALLAQVSRHSCSKTAELFRVYARLAAVEQECADLRKLLHEREQELDMVGDEADNAIHHLRCLVNFVALRIPDVVNPPDAFVTAAYYLSKQDILVEA